MKAAVHVIYGLPEVISVQEVETPTPKDNELLIRVYATTVNRTDCHILWGKPFFMRLFTGLFKPRLTVTGTDFAGQIEATGKNVKHFKTGDRVMGFEFWGLQSHAHYLTLAENKDIIIIPGDISYNQAVACIEGAFYALNVIQKMKPTAGQKALVNGATGAIGSSMVQFFKFYGVSVTAVCSGENSELVISIGADKIIDYKTEDFTKDKDQYDFVFDAAGNSTFGQCKPLLKKKGMYSTSGAPNLFLLLSTILSGGKKFVFAPPKNLKACLSFITELVEKGSFKPVIDRKYPIDKISEAFNYVASGQKIGNVILKMDA
jgi:NADPH:quinone reductase-like Zn-dependent oxidoreductase